MFIDETNSDGTQTGEPTTSTDNAAANTDSTTATDAGEGKGQGETAGDAGDGTDTKGDKPDGEGTTTDVADAVPETYTVPDLEGTEYDKPTGARMESIIEFAKKAEMTQAEFDASYTKYVELRTEERLAERGDWAVQSETEYGKDFKTIASNAQAALVEAEKIRPGITERLDATNLGNHPDVLWVFNQLGALAKPSSIIGVGNETGNPGEKSTQDRMWPNANAKP